MQKRGKIHLLWVFFAFPAANIEDSTFFTLALNAEMGQDLHAFALRPFCIASCAICSALALALPLLPRINTVRYARDLSVKLLTSFG